MFANIIHPLESPTQLPFSYFHCKYTIEIRRPTKAADKEHDVHGDRLWLRRQPRIHSIPATFAVARQSRSAALSSSASTEGATRRHLKK